MARTTEAAEIREWVQHQLPNGWRVDVEGQTGPRTLVRDERGNVVARFWSTTQLKRFVRVIRQPVRRVVS